MKILWVLSGIILIVLAGAFAYSYYPMVVENEVNVCMHLSDYNNETIGYLKDLNAKSVRTDWLIIPDNSMRDFSLKLQDNGINLLVIVDTNTWNHQDFTLAEWNKTLTQIANSAGLEATDAVEKINWEVQAAILY